MRWILYDETARNEGATDREMPQEAVTGLVMWTVNEGFQISHSLNPLSLQRTRTSSRFPSIFFFELSSNIERL